MSPGPSRLGRNGRDGRKRAWGSPIGTVHSFSINQPLSIASSIDTNPAIRAYLVRIEYIVAALQFCTQSEVAVPFACVIVALLADCCAAKNIEDSSVFTLFGIFSYGSRSAARGVRPVIACNVSWKRWTWRGLGSGRSSASRH